MWNTYTFLYLCLFNSGMWILSWALILARWTIWKTLFQRRVATPYSVSANSFCPPVLLSIYFPGYIQDTMKENMSFWCKNAMLKNIICMCFIFILTIRAFVSIWKETILKIWHRHKGIWVQQPEGNSISQTNDSCGGYVSIYIVICLGEGLVEKESSM